jgi:hypothetical protein
VQELDLTSLDNIRKAAGELRAAHPRIDLLINNAGVMYTDKAKTKDGFELQFGTNHLGHFALTGQLLDNMLAVDGSRVVTVSSVGHRIRARIHFEDLQLENNYDRVVAYGQIQAGELAVHLRAGAPPDAQGFSDDRDGRLTPAPPTPTCFATCRAASGRSASSCGRTSSRRARTWAPNRRCAPPPIRAKNAEYYGPAASASSVAPESRQVERTVA